MTISTENLIHTYSPGSPFEKTAVDGVSFTLTSGEVMGVIGHTGSGKSTLIRHLNGLLKPTSGTVKVDGEDIFAKGYKRGKLRSRVGLVFQYPEYQLFDETVEKDIAFGPRNMGCDDEEIKRRVAKAAEFAGLTEAELKASPFELSGGQKRRAALAGVLAMEPEALILDEPAAGLDPVSRRRIMLDILAFAKETNAAILLVSHSMEDIAAYTNKVAVMRDGKFVMQGETREIFSRVGELAEHGLSVPQVTRICTECGCEGTVLTVEEGAKALSDMLRGCAE
ncbi:MAG: energy-coupling factor transporter ATPase [Clostridia bacterium]|nr:energy-coupling factor transporter ATPase [Clostridia bacterium]